MLFFIILALTYKIAGIGESGSKYCKVTEIKLSKPARVSLICVLVVSFLFVEYIVLNRCRAQLIFENIKQKDLRGQYALAEIDKAMRFCPTNSLYLNKKGDLLSEIDPSSAEECYKKAININPARADYHLDLGHLYIAIGKDDLAQAEFRKASLLDPQSIRINSNA
jgi:Tfp pilus assembly protein PilF